MCRDLYKKLFCLFQLNSYKDWFNHDWYDKIRDYEWDPTANRRNGYKRRELETLSDSVPLRFNILTIPNYLEYNV